MAHKEFKFTVVTPDKCFLKDVPVLSVTAFGSEGCFTALPGHVPFLTDLKPNIVTYKDINGEEDTFFVGGGYAEVLPAEVTILAVSAEKLHDIDLDRAERSKNNALARLKQGKTLGARAIDLAKLDLTPAEEARLKRERIDIVAEQAAVERSVARVRVARKRDMYPHKH